MKSNYFSDSQMLDSKFANSNKPIFQNWMSGDEDDVFIQLDNFRVTNFVHKYSEIKYKIHCELQ